MNEKFLQYIWQFKLFNTNNLYTTDLQSIEIIQAGTPNNSDGPDFFNAKIKINDTIWAGNIEIHIKKTDWQQHQHHQNPTYNNVILHVVLENNTPTLPTPHHQIPTLCLQGLIHPLVYKNYLQIAHNQSNIPCSKVIHHVSNITIQSWLHRLLIERLEQKTIHIYNTLQQNQNHWEQTFFEHLTQAFGINTNNAPFLQLAKTLPITTLAKHKNNLTQLEALFLGQAGFLNTQSADTEPDNYFLTLQKEFSFLQHKHTLTPINVSSWKFGGLRPPTYPTLRIAQLAALVHHSSALFSKILEAPSLQNCMQLFDIQASEYWNNHYILNKTTPKSYPKKLTSATIQLLFINTIIPTLFLYGKQKNIPHYQDRALEWLEQLPPENNSIVEEWRQIKIIPQNAFDTQAFIQLKKNYCNSKRCCECAIGNKILQIEWNKP